MNRAPDWFAPWRLPYRDRHLHHPMLVAVAGCPAGVRLRFRTDSTSVALAVEHRLVGEIELSHEPVYDLTVDGALAGSAGTANPTFTGLPPGDKLVEVWLPQFPGVRVGALTIDDGATAEPAPDARPRWITYGSSITHCIEADTPTRTWPAVAARRRDWHLTSLGFAGMAHLDPLVARVIASLPADRISLKVGINIHNLQSLRQRTFAPMLHGFLASIRDGHPDAPITLISPILSPERETSARTMLRSADGTERPVDGDLTLEQMREIIAAVVDARRDPNLEHLDGRELFGADDLDHLPDGLHPDTEGYRRIGERFAARVA